jgi:hypothetical protein
VALTLFSAKTDANHVGRAQGQALASALGLDMARCYRPTAAGYFSRIGKAAILADLEAARQMPCGPSGLKMKKGELAALAERETAETGRPPHRCSKRLRKGPTGPFRFSKLTFAAPLFFCAPGRRPAPQRRPDKRGATGRNTRPTPCTGFAVDRGHVRVAARPEN